MSSKTRLSALPSVDDGRVASVSDDILSEIPNLPGKLSAKEKKVWAHVTEALKEYGLIHRTDGMLLMIICRTFSNWVDAEADLEKFKAGNDGSYIVETANGYRSPHPSYYVSRDLKKELLAWLPEAALTIQSFHKIKGDKIGNGQADLFDDPVEAFRNQKAGLGMRVVK